MKEKWECAAAVNNEEIIGLAIISAYSERPCMWILNWTSSLPPEETHCRYRVEIWNENLPRISLSIFHSPLG